MQVLINQLAKHEARMVVGHTVELHSGFG